ncbi:MAG: hypothetical protein JXQ99_01425 [Hyphomicrobiaceae bacterium]
MRHPNEHFARLRWLAMALTIFAVTTTVPAAAKRSADSFAARLGGDERQSFEGWYRAQIFHGAALDAYWAKVEKKRRVRRSKRRQRQAFTHRDYVTTWPPTYSGPKISKKLIRQWRTFRDADKPITKRRRTELPGLKVYLASARRHFNFAPERIPEAEFKRRYAREALSLGLTKDQVIRVYALETGGRGTADMQAGISPTTGKGRPISSALGYAQLLAANSVNVLSKHGPGFVKRLTRMIQRETNPRRRRQLQVKLDVLRGMVRTARSVPYKWSRHVAFAKTSRGRALHVMNMDGVIGPWMQVVKLADLKRMAARKGRKQLSGAEIELMNLAGPATGLEMMRETGIDKPTTNFFSRRAYYRNTVVRNKDSQRLLEALEQRMQAGIKNKGAQEFIAMFNEVLGVRRTTKPHESATQAFGFVPRAFRPAN